MIEQLSSGIKMDFEVKRMEPLFGTRLTTMSVLQAAMPATTVKTGDLPPMRATATWALTPVPPPPRWPWSARTEACFTVSTTTITEALGHRHPGHPEIKASCQRPPIAWSCSTGYGEALLNPP